MSFGFSKSQEAEIERQALASGGSVTKPIQTEACPEPLETRMSWSETEFSAEFEKLFKSLGWVGYHTWLSIRSKPGFPDWTLVRGHRLLFVELKKQKGKLEPEQEMWRDLLLEARQEWFMFKPADWEQIEATLARPQ